MDSYLTNVKQIELEARFNNKLGHRIVKVPVYFEYVPYLGKLHLVCKCEKEGIDKSFMCSIEIDISTIINENEKIILYQQEESFLNALCDWYKQKMIEIERKE